MKKHKTYPRTIPDLRADAESISLDHCYVLLEKMGNALALMEGRNDSIQSAIIQHLDVTLFRDFLDERFSASAFSDLYHTELGKGVLVGLYINQLFNISRSDDSEDDI